MVIEWRMCSETAESQPVGTSHMSVCFICRSPPCPKNWNIMRSFVEKRRLGLSTSLSWSVSAKLTSRNPFLHCFLLTTWPFPSLYCFIVELIRCENTCNCTSLAKTKAWMQNPVKVQGSYSLSDDFKYDILQGYENITNTGKHVGTAALTKPHLLIQLKNKANWSTCSCCLKHAY